MCAIAYHHGIYLRLVTVFLLESSLCRSDKIVEKILLYKIDGTAAKSATHDARTGHATLAGDIIEKVKLLTAHLVIVGKSPVSLIHFLAYRLIITCHESITDSEYAVFLLDDKFCAGNNPRQ